mmetsp:Transcript_31527/g.78582  ORF Transcript_31527/g.78582 Transcript_31527/m.78582 type:complete len:174 (+) Transcript_31527:98-619(+)
MAVEGMAVAMAVLMAEAAPVEAQEEVALQAARQGGREAKREAAARGEYAEESSAVEAAEAGRAGTWEAAPGMAVRAASKVVASREVEWVEGLVETEGRGGPSEAAGQEVVWEACEDMEALVATAPPEAGGKVAEKVGAVAAEAERRAGQECKGCESTGTWGSMPTPRPRGTRK